MLYNDAFCKISTNKAGLCRPDAGEGLIVGVEAGAGACARGVGVGSVTLMRARG